MATTLQMLPNSGGIQTILSTELNSLAFGAPAIGSAIDNIQATGSYSGYPFCQLELVIAALAAAPMVNNVVSFWFVRSADGTNYEDGSASVVPLREPDALFFPLSVATAQRLIGVNGTGADRGSTRVRVPVGKWKPLFQWNRATNTGVTGMASGGNTVKIITDTDQQV